MESNKITIEVELGMTDDLKAKELFRKYNYSTFYMGRASVEDYNKYKDFKISDDKELEWIHEYQRELIKACYSSKKLRNLHDCFLKFCISKSNFPDIINLEELIVLMNFKREGLDSFTKMRMAEDVLKLIVKALINNGFTTRKATMELKKIAIRMLNDVILEPVAVDSEYSLSNSISINSLLPENILNRAKAALKDWS